jgi:hypothetical protein
MSQRNIQAHRSKLSINERLRAILRAGPCTRYAIERRIGSRGSAAGAIAALVKAGEIERCEEGWQLKPRADA